MFLILNSIVRILKFQEHDKFHVQLSFITSVGLLDVSIKF